MRISARAARPLLCAALALVFAAPAQAQPPSDEEVGQHVQAVMLGTFFHELGHALVSMLDLPVVGPEEDVADEFSTMLLIAVAEHDPAAAQVPRAVAQGFLDFKEMRERGTLGQIPFWDEHGLDDRRAFAAICLMYGYDPQGMEPIFQRFGVDERGRRRCKAGFDRKWRAWETLLEPHTWPEGATPPPGAPSITVAYQPSARPFGQVLYRALTTVRGYDEIARGLSSVLRLPGPLAITWRDCDTPNAFFMPGKNTITMCYDLAELYGQMFLAARQGGGPAPGGQAPAPPPSAAPALAGVWQGQSTDIFGMPAMVQVVLEPGGRFTQMFRSATGAMLRVWGRYAAQPGIIDFFIDGWEPRQQCGGGSCAPIRLPDHDRVDFSLLDANTIRTATGVFYRIQ